MGPGSAVLVVLHPVVTVYVSVGITQPVVHVGHTFLVTVAVGVLGQQSVLYEERVRTTFKTI